MGRLVVVRHGESEFNREDRFSGWVDTPLTEKGREGARQAGTMLRRSGFVPDVVYTTRLSRARDTTREILKAIGKPSLRPIESDALLERHYGALTGLNKEETRATHKDAPYIADPYDQRPPAITPDNPHHPDNPAKELKVIGFPANGKGAESIHDVTDRVMPLWLDDILPRLQRGENVLISAHANTLRALSMITEGLTGEQLKGSKIPNATPVEISIRSEPGS